MARKSERTTPITLPPQPGEGHPYRIEATLTAEVQAHRMSTVSALPNTLFETVKANLVEPGFESGVRRKAQGPEGKKSTFVISVELFAYLPAHVTDAKEAKHVWHQVISSIPIPESSWQTRIGPVDSLKMLLPPDVSLSASERRKRRRQMRTPKRAR